MATEIISQTWCDICLTRDDTKVVAEPAHLFTLDNLTKHVDLCKNHRAEYVDPLAEFLSRYGETVPSGGARAKAPSPSAMGLAPSQRPTECPVCRQTYATASTCRGHLIGVHGMSRAEALQALPARERPRAPMVPCPVCGREFQKGPGMKSHMSVHPDK